MGGWEFLVGSRFLNPESFEFGYLGILARGCLMVKRSERREERTQPEVTKQSNENVENRKKVKRERRYTVHK